MSRGYRLLDGALGRNAIPDSVLRAGSRSGARIRERREAKGGVTAQDDRLRALIQRMRTGPIAELPEIANQQHYELPPEFFELVLGPRRKYSACLWEQGTDTLAAAEEAMLELTCERAGVRDGMKILDLGCGWGSLSLWLAERYPNALITAVSNSAGQRRLIEAECARRGFERLAVVTADINEFDPGERFDRVISIEMFEHMRNWRQLLQRISGWLNDDGRLFVHVFSHRTLSYLFEGTWAAERFFTAGLMPSHELIARFQDELTLEDAWAVPGTHYARTLDAWLGRLDENSERVLELLRDSGRTQREARTMLGGWRLFLISTSEIWRRNGGNSWMVSHYLLAPRSVARRSRQETGRAPDVLRIARPPLADVLLEQRSA
jgi:cyclopropane-fatty-acyl-phospholipid synthase